MSKSAPHPPTPETRSLRQALGEFATGVTVVTALAADGTPVGMTVNSFASVSLDPPLVSWCLMRAAHSLPVFEHASHYAVNVLAADQEELSQRFSHGRGDRFAGIEWTPGVAGLPLLRHCCAWFECRIVERVPAGDHLILLGQVERFHREQKTHPAPLLYYGGRYRTLSAD